MESSLRSFRSGHPSAWRTALLGLLLLSLGLGVAQASEAKSGPTLSGVVNINTANAQQLQLLPGVGKVRADAIVALRKEQGRFESIDQLTRVKGIGESMLERMRPHVTLNGKTTAQGSASASKKKK
jgi:competence protein ComEA